MGVTSDKIMRKKFINPIKRNPLFFMFFLPMSFDALLTVLGQAPEYWQNYYLVNEASPVYIVLTISPYLFLLLSALWIVGWYFLIRKLKFPFNLFFATFFLIGHSWGSSTWIKKLIFHNILTANRSQITIYWFVLMGYFVICAFLATLSFWEFLKQKDSYSF